MSPSDFEKVITSIAPQVWSKTYPRVYEETGRFHSPKLAAYGLANGVLSAVLEGGLDTQSAGVMNQFINACLVDKHNVPTFFITKSIVQACNATNLPDDMKWTSIPMPHPGMVLVFEKGSVQHPMGGEVGYVSVSKHEPHTEISHSSCPGITRRLLNGAFIVTFMAHETQELFTYDLAVSDANPYIRNVMTTDIVTHDAEMFLAAPVTASEVHFNQVMSVLAIKIILLMNARPEQISEGKMRKRVNLGGGSKREFWTPNIVGHSYKVAQQQDSEPGDGKKRMHWRRGHFTRHPYGPGRTLRKTIWIEPMLIGSV